ncbi:hypothetical protein HUW63_21400 [Myxococcus sp. AM001]|nr:hypothetical protein [Myxococcus sp. AM001]
MDVDEMSRQIEEAQARIRELQKEMTELMPSIIAAVAADVMEWSKTAAKNAAQGFVTSNPKQYAELSVRLPKLKAATDAMLGRLPSLVAQELNRIQSWAHTSEDAMNGHVPSWTVMEEDGRTWARAARTLYGFIAQPLGEHGFLSPGTRDYAPWVPDSANPRHYVLGVGFGFATMPGAIRIALHPYKERWTELRQLRDRVAVLERERAKTSFTNIWGE